MAESVKPEVKVDATPKKKRHRSPSYPAIHLEEAIQRAKTVYEHERRNVAPLSAILAHWKYGAKSSSGLLCAAALKKFGLLVEVTGSEARHLRLSELALKIILDEREDSPDRTAAIKQAALSPGLHQEVWQKWGNELPSTATIRTFLILDKEFTEQAANQFIEEYRHTISFAGLTAGDTIPTGGANSEDEDEDAPIFNQPNRQGTGAQMNAGAANAQVHKSVTPPPPAGKPSTPGAPADHKDFPVYLSNHQKAILYIPPTLSAKDYELLKRQIENHLMVIQATSVTDDPQN